MDFPIFMINLRLTRQKMGWVDPMVIKHEISIINDIDFKVLVHIFVGKRKKPEYSPSQGGNFEIQIDEMNPFFSIFRQNPWDEKNLLIIFLLFIISTLFLPWGGIMEESYAPFGCNSILHINPDSLEKTVFSLKGILRTNKRALRVWHYSAIIQFALLDLFIFGIFLSISFLGSPLFSWIARCVGLALFVAIGLRMKRQLKNVYAKYTAVLNSYRCE